MTAADEERDRRTGLTRVLQAIAAVERRVEANRSELARVHERLDRLEAARRDPVPAIVDLGEIRRTVTEALDTLDPDAVAEAVRSRVIDELSVATGGAIGGQEVLVEAVRRAVEASHRVMIRQLTALLAERFAELRHELGEEQAATLREVSLDVEAIRRAIERAGGATR